jgi:hypothetical protein
LQKGCTNVKYFPLYPVKALDYGISESNYEYDLVFYGALNQRRIRLLKLLDEQYRLLVIYNKKGHYSRKGRDPKFKHSIDICYGEDLFKVLSKCKVVLNIHYYKGGIQEQARLFELLSNNKTVVSEKSKHNYFEDITEYESDEELLDILDLMLNRNVKLFSCFYVYNEIKWLPTHLNWCRKNGIDFYVIDHMSTDGTWEWLQKNGIPSHRFDNGGSFHLNQLQQEALKIINTIGKDYDWIAYGDPDTFIQFDKPLIDVIKQADREGYDFIETNTVNLANTGELKDNHPCNVYKYGTIMDRRQIKIARNKNLIYSSDVFKLTDKTKLKYVPGLIINYGATKDISLRKEYLARREKAWKEGLYKGYGTHYNDIEPRDKKKLTNLESNEYYNKFIKENQDIIEFSIMGYTADITIKNNLVYKSVKDKVTRFKVSAEELVQREIYWLKKLEPYNISPKFVAREGNTVIMTYCGEPLTSLDGLYYQLLNIIKILLENYCFYNDFKLDNFTLKDGKLYIIDFGWASKINEDYTCGGIMESELKEKPYKNIFSLFDNLKPVDKYLTETKYFNLTNKLKELSPTHWVTNKNGDTFNKRWEYHREATRLLRELNPNKVLEAGTMGVQLWDNSDTIDYDLPKSGWNLVYTPTYSYDLKVAPWKVINDKQYDVFVALRVFHHFKEVLLDEMLRIAPHVILALSESSAIGYRAVRKPDYEYQCKESDTVILYYKDKPKKTSLSIGLVYSGRVPGIFDIWMKQLLKDTKDFDRELIIINNSGKKLNLKYDIPVKEIMDDYEVPAENHKLKLSQFLARSYSRILKESKGELIHLREDDIVPLEGSFPKMVEYIRSHKDSALTGVYQSRNVPSRDAENFKKDNPSKIMEVDAFGTGMSLFWKNNCPHQFHGRLRGLTSHDWCWCYQCKEASNKLYAITDAVCKHYTDDKNYVLPSGKLRPSAHFIKLREEKRKRVIIKQK